MNRRTHVMRASMAILLILGAVGFAGLFFATPWLPATTELPLGHLQGIAVDSRGRVYCGLQFYSRVQVYDANGEYLRGWHVDSGNGSFRVRINSADHLEVATARGGMFYEFDADGNLLQRQELVPHYYQGFGAEGETTCGDTTGASYTIHSALLFPHVVKREPTGRTTTVVKTAMHTWFIMGPFPGFVFWTAGIVLLIIAKKRAKTHRHRGQTDVSH